MTGTDSKVEKSRIRNRNHPSPKTYSKTYSGADSRLESLTALVENTSLSPLLLPYSPERGENGFETVSVGVMSQIMASSEKTSWRERGEIVLGEEEGARE